MSSFIQQQRPASTPKRVASNASILTSKQAFHEESLYYVCLQLMTRLTRVPHMIPYIELAHAHSEDLALEQRRIVENHAFVEESMAESCQGHWTTALKTFATGVLPRGVMHDPVTALSNLFKLGAPFCLIYNAISVEDPLEVVTSDDMKVCKMSIYKFLLACKQKLNIRDDELFPVTMPFSNDSSHLKRVIKSVEFVLNLDPSFDCLPVRDNLVSSDTQRSKVVREIVETERKFVQDLETLVRYREDLLGSELFTSENVNLLFPNLLDIVDFQRRFLVGLETQANVHSHEQRIGSLFVHAGVSGFKIYQSWALSQNASMELIMRDASRLEQASQIIKDPYELQNFYLIKPIQRLTKYPLLLRQLIKETDPNAPYFSELIKAQAITKEVARGINEAQRRADNVKYLRALRENVVDWKGYDTDNVGDLLYFNVVTIKDLLTDGHSNEKEIHCYLFDKVIYFFKEPSSRSKLLSRKATNSTGSSAVQLVLNGLVYVNKITRCTVSDSTLYFPNQTGHFLSLKWKGNKDTGGCIMRFRSEEQLLQWDSAIKRLSEMNGQVPEPEEVYPSSAHSSGSFASFRNSSNSAGRMRTASTSSFTASMGSYPPLPNEKKNRSVSVASTSSTGTKYRKSSSNTSLGAEELLSNVSNLTISKPYSSGSATPTSLGFMDKTFIKLTFGALASPVSLSVSSELNHQELTSVLLKKAYAALGETEPLKFRYRDEDGDLVRFTNNEDWEMAKDQLAPGAVLEIEAGAK